MIAVAWLATIAAAPDLNALLSVQLMGTTPVSAVEFFLLVTVMMVAMMLPAALPMVAVYHQMARATQGKSEAIIDAALFSLSYVIIWGSVTVAALIGLMAVGLMGTLAPPFVVLPGVILVGAGAYQFTSWKQYCLRKCRTPIGFLIGHWRPGRRGAFRLGVSHSVYCMGCCWLLMAVVFVTGAMGLLWMGVFAFLILVEKVWNRGEWFSRLMGLGAVVVGGAVASFAIFPGL
ncbi:MAG TPA: DUF2182 domain-containing protein [Thermoplasmata archaeon]|nr:DUF2182 domain-containing protein [Thermoplasmata archaeon]